MQQRAPSLIRPLHTSMAGVSRVSPVSFLNAKPRMAIFFCAWGWGRRGTSQPRPFRWAAQPPLRCRCPVLLTTVLNMAEMTRSTNLGGGAAGGRQTDQVQAPTAVVWPNPARRCIWRETHAQNPKTLAALPPCTWSSGSRSWPQPGSSTQTPP